MRIFLVSIFILLSLIGCNSKADYAYFQQVDSLMSAKDLDSAQVMLNAVSPSSLSSLGEAYHAFLSSYIPYKRYQKAENDSLIMVAVDYFKKNNRDNLLARCYLVRSGILADLGYKNLAISNSIQAETECDTTDYYTLAVINMQLASFYGDSYIANNDIAINKYKKSLYYYRKCNNAYSSVSALYKIGMLYHSISFDSVTHYLRTAILEAKDCNHIVIETGAAVKFAQIAIHNDTMVLESKNSLLSLLKRKLTNHGRYMAVSSLVSAYVKLGDLDSASYYANAFSSNDIPSTEVLKNDMFRSLYESQGDYRKAYYHLELADHISDSILNAARAGELYAIEKEFDYSEANARMYEAESEKQQLLNIYLISLIVLIVLALIVAQLIRRRIRRTRYELALALELVESLRVSKDMVEQQLSSRSNGESSLSPILDRVVELIESLPKYENQPKMFVAEFKKVLHLSDRDDAMNFICDMVNESYQGAVYRLRDIHSLKLHELSVVCMVSLEFSNSAMRVVLDHKNQNTIYNYRNLVKRKFSLETCDRASVVEILSRNSFPQSL